MLGVGAATRIYVATGATDMRLGFNGLYGLGARQTGVRSDQWSPVPVRKFASRPNEDSRLRWLEFMGVRTSYGRRAAALARSRRGPGAVSREEFALLLGGIDLRETRKRKW